MYLSEERKSQLLARHSALLELSKYLDVKDESQWLNYVKNVFLFEKNLESSKDPSYAQSLLFTDLLSSDKQLKKVILSKEWQKANEYFTLSHNATDLLDTFYQLEIGNLECTEKNKLLRTKLIRNAFFIQDVKGQVQHNKVALSFVFSENTPRWDIEHIEWNIQEQQGESVLVGVPYISLGMPKPDGNEMYREIFAVTGSEKKAVAILGVQSLLWNNQPMRITAKEVMDKLPNDIDKLKELANKLPADLKRVFQTWLQRDVLEREFTKTGLSFLCDMLYCFSQSGYKKEEVYLLDRFDTFGFRLDKVSKTTGYDFSATVPLHETIYSKPTISCYIPKDNVWEELLTGKASISAGPVPPFLQEAYHLVGIGKLQPRPEDFQAVKDLFLFIQYGEKVPKPPILPIYNALRRWLEELSRNEEYKYLEKLCNLARILRPYIHIPCLGEKPCGLLDRDHKIILKLAPDQKPGVIIGIKQAGILVPEERLPLCLPGVYWVARQQTCLEKLLEMNSGMILEAPEEIRDAWKILGKEVQKDALLVFLNYLLADIGKLPIEQWEMICNTIKDWNNSQEKPIPFLAAKLITYEEFQELESNKEYRIKLAHTLKVGEGTVISQELTAEQCIIVLGSGVPPKLLQSIETLYKWALERKFMAPENTIEAIRCRLKTFLESKEQIQPLQELIVFCKTSAEFETVKEDVEILEGWLSETQK